MGHRKSGGAHCNDRGSMEVTANFKASYMKTNLQHQMKDMYMKQNKSQPTAVISELPIASIIKVIKIGSCHNISGKHKLTYQIGCNESQEICFRVIENSGGGYFSSEWVTLHAIQKVIETAATPTTSTSLFPLFKGKSVNTPAFLLAVLVNEKLVELHTENTRAYQLTNHAEFLTEIKKLAPINVEIDTSTNIPTFK